MDQSQRRQSLKYHHDGRQAVICDQKAVDLAGQTPVSREITLYHLEEVSTEALTEELWRRGHEVTLRKAR